jgi:hypothetical protein
MSPPRPDPLAPSAGPLVPIALVVELTSQAARRPFLLDHVVQLVPAVTPAAAFADLGGHAVEVLLEQPDRAAFTAWISGIGRSGHAVSIRAVRNMDERSDGQHGEARGRYLQASYSLSARALDLLADHEPDVPTDVATAETWKVHRDTGRPRQSAGWHVAWLRAVRGEGPWPDPADGGARLAARLAHAHWLRLTGGNPATGAEIDALGALLATHQPSSWRSRVRPID